MALLGFHIVVSLIAVTILSKFRARFSFARFLLSSGLVRYLPPTTQQLKETVPAFNNGKVRRRKQDRDELDAVGFSVSKSTAFSLSTMPVLGDHLVSLPLYSTVSWLLDFSLFSLLVYGASETFTWLAPTMRDFNVSLIWLGLGIAFCLQALARLTAAFVFDVEDVSQRSLIICCTALYFVLCMAMTMFADHFFDVRFLPAYRNFTNTTNEFLRAMQLPEYQFIDSGNLQADARGDRRSPLLLYLTLSVMFSGLAGMLVFPNFRYAKMYTGAVRTASAPVKLCLHFTFLFPIVSLLLWTHPVTEYVLHGPRKLLTSDQLDTLRVLFILAGVVLRVATRRFHLQAHLDLAFDRVMQLRREAGNINSMELQRTIFRFFSYICAAALQYFAPVLLQLFLALLLKTLGGYSWLGRALPYSGPEVGQLPVVVTTGAALDPTTLAALNTIFNATVLRGLFGFALIVVLVINLSLSMVGVAYNTYFASQ